MWTLIFLMVMYFLPTMVAYRKRNMNAILAVNLFLGWTLIGWVVALAWAFVRDKD